MKRDEHFSFPHGSRLGFCVALALLVSRPMDAATVIGTVRDSFGNLISTNVTFKAARAIRYEGGVIRAGWMISTNSAADGTFSVNLYAGDYLVTYGGGVRESDLITAPTNTGPYDIGALSTNAANSTFLYNDQVTFIGAGAGTAGTVGLVPAPLAGEQMKFLRADGSWITLSGGGDMVGANNLSEVGSPPAALAKLGGLANLNGNGSNLVLRQSANALAPLRLYGWAAGQTGDYLSIADGSSNLVFKLDKYGVLYGNGAGLTNVSGSTNITDGIYSVTVRSNLFLDGYADITGTLRVRNGIQSDQDVVAFGNFSGTNFTARRGGGFFGNGTGLTNLYAFPSNTITVVGPVGGMRTYTGNDGLTNAFWNATNYDTITIGPGIYTFKSYKNTSGQAFGGLQMRNLHTVTVRGESAVLSTTNYGTMLSLLNCSNVTVKDLVFDGDRTDILNYLTNNWGIQGALWVGSTNEDVHLSHTITIERCKFYNIPDQAISFIGGGNLAGGGVFNARVKDCVFNVVGQTNVNAMGDLPDGACISGAMLGGEATGNEVYDCIYFFEQDGECSRALQVTNPVVVAHNRVMSVYTYGIIVNAMNYGGSQQQMTFSDNYIKTRPGFEWRFGVETAGICVRGPASNIVMQGNTILGFTNIPSKSIMLLDNYGKLADISILGNHLFDAASSAIWLEQRYHTNTFRNIRISGNDMRIAQKDPGWKYPIITLMAPNATVEDNTFSDGWGTEYWQPAIYLTHATGDWITNNVIRHNRFCPTNSAANVLYLTADYAGTVFEDNLIVPAVTTQVAGAATIANVQYRGRGTGEPTIAVANGSRYTRTDGGAGTTAYSREAGAWVALGSGGSGSTEYVAAGTNGIAVVTNSSLYTVSLAGPIASVAITSATATNVYTLITNRYLGTDANGKLIATNAPTGGGSTNLVDGTNDFTAIFNNVTSRSNLNVVTFNAATQNLGTLVLSNSLSGTNVDFAAGANVTFTTNAHQVVIAATLAGGAASLQDATNAAIGVVSSNAPGFATLQGSTNAAISVVASNSAGFIAAQAATNAAIGVVTSNAPGFLLPAATNTANWITANGNPKAAELVASTNSANWITANAVSPTAALTANSSTTAGVVSSGAGQNAQVWKTDASGNPGWRADATGGSGSTNITDEWGNIIRTTNVIVQGTLTANTFGVVTLNAGAFVLTNNFTNTIVAPEAIAHWTIAKDGNGDLEYWMDTDANSHHFVGLLALGFGSAYYGLQTGLTNAAGVTIATQIANATNTPNWITASALATTATLASGQVTNALPKIITNATSALLVSNNVSSVPTVGYIPKIAADGTVAWAADATGASGMTFTNYLLDCTAAKQVYTINFGAPRVPTTIIKSNATYNAEIVVNLVTNTITGSLIVVDCIPVLSTDSNWVVRW